jgi:tRNA pseudouridine38-40 synthase
MVGSLEKMGTGQKDMNWFSDLLRPDLNHGAPTAPAEGLILMEVGYQGLEWQVDEYSRERAATAMLATVQRRMAGAMVAREMEWGMTEKGR